MDNATAAVARVALDRSVRLLVRHQQADGGWDDGPPVASSRLAASLLALDLLGQPAHASVIARRIRSRHRPDGSWPELPGGAPDPAVTIACYLALRLAGEPADAYPMALAAGWIRDSGGLAQADAVTWLWLRLAGFAPGDFIPAGGRGATSLSPGTAGRLASLADQITGIAVPLAVIALHRPARRSPDFGISEIMPPSSRSREAPPARRVTGAGVTLAAQHPGTRRPGTSLTARGCADWMLGHQAQDGSWDRSVALTVFSLVALGQLGYEAASPAITRGLRWLSGEPGSSARATGLAVSSLELAGLPASHPAVRAARAFLDRERPDPAGGPVPGSLATGLAGLAPDQDGVAPGLGGLAPDPGGAAPAAAAALDLSRLCAAGLGAGKRARSRVVWLLRAQLSDGAWAGWRGLPDAAVTTAVLRALVQAGVRPAKAPVRSAIGWLARSQAADGGWSVPGMSGGASSSDATAAAVLALIAHGGAEATVSAERGVSWLATAQGAAGDWPAPDGMWPDRPCLYLSRLSCAMQALASYLREKETGSLA
jgi:squalene-hopene/tetraprenyl-beta-curcumene cyclase